MEEEDDDKREKKEEGGHDFSEKMMETRTIILSGEVDKDLAEKVVTQLLLLEAAGDDPIKVFID
ncbi:MAG: ATP-dependent Clp protease proteolytic subunit, partial [Bacteroidetes bacterium]